MTDFDMKPSIRLPQRAQDILMHGGGREIEKLAPIHSAMHLAILEELDRLHSIVRKHNLS